MQFIKNMKLITKFTITLTIKRKKINYIKIVKKKLFKNWQKT